MKPKLGKMAAGAVAVAALIGAVGYPDRTVLLCALAGAAVAVLLVVG